ncbi:hypothetical protein AARAC_011267 [Aspergillus arachidicola]|uniref:FAD-binding PCMH-type domain-containing protein n=1 Tax=Aspergillus arachidicola TaxID=656916 RepID=A0A2G7G8D4_9EURO|nr:hypothetical protein AARAC_011267 [Aspergillus arachidicola]
MCANTLSKLSGLRTTVAPDCEILHERIRRWTNIDRKIPTATILPRSEEDCLKTVKIRVQWVLQLSIPFEPTCGGHSAWSTIGEEGIIIDMSHYADVHVEADSKTATLASGILSKQVGVRLAEAGLFTALGNGNTVGAIPYSLGGGASITSTIAGFGSDQIVSARVIITKDGGRLVEVAEKEHPDLLWALRGAGQFFGLVTQLTIRAHPFSLLRKQQGLYPPPYAGPGGMMMIVAPPPTRTPSLVIAARYTGDEYPEVLFKPLNDLHPLVTTGRDVPIQNFSDAREVLCAKGDFKQFGVVGLHDFDAEGFLQTIDTWKKLVHDCRDAINTGFHFQWDSRPIKTPDIESVTSLHGIRYWQYNLV